MQREKIREGIGSTFVVIARGSSADVFFKNEWQQNPRIAVTSGAYGGKD